MSSSPIIVALDYSDADSCIAMVEKLDPQRCRVKVGKELFVSLGPKIIEAIQARGFAVFLDLKFHDIPNTVAKAVNAAADLGVWMMNVHVSGGRRMLMAARESLAKRPGEQPLLIGVTVLTSIDDTDLLELGIQQSAGDRARQLAGLAHSCGLDGVVCSAHEAASLRNSLGDDFCLVTPGIRPATATADDQRRVMTPVQALAAGSTYLVVGRPITQAADPTAACDAIIDSLN